MSKEIEELETMDEFSDEEYSAYLEYMALKDQCVIEPNTCLLYTSPSPRDKRQSRMPSSA